MAPADYLIVGAGIAGASLAWKLAGENSVTLLEAEAQPGYHATGRSAAFFSEIYGNDSIRSLTRASRTFFEQPPANFSEQPLLESCGCLIIASAAERAALRQQFEEFGQYTAGLELESGEFALNRVPVLEPECVSACIWEPGAQRIDVDALLQGFLRGFRRKGGNLITDARVVSARRKDSEWTVRAGADEYEGRVLVNAAGAWADEMARNAGVAPIGLTPLRRTVCVIDTDDEWDCSAWPAVTDLDENFYFMPDAGRLLLSPADETVTEPGDAYPDDIDIATAVDRLEHATKLRVRRVVQSWAGLRTFAPDRTPVVGFDPSVHGFFWLAGQGGYGIQTAPGMLRLAVSLLRDQSAPSELQGVTAAVAPDRFGSGAA